MLRELTEPLSGQHPDEIKRLIAAALPQPLSATRERRQQGPAAAAAAGPGERPRLDPETAEALRQLRPTQARPIDHAPLASPPPSDAPARGPFAGRSPSLRRTRS